MDQTEVRVSIAFWLTVDEIIDWIPERPVRSSLISNLLFAVNGEYALRATLIIIISIGHPTSKIEDGRGHNPPCSRFRYHNELSDLQILDAILVSCIIVYG